MSERSFFRRTFVVWPALAGAVLALAPSCLDRREGAFESSNESRCSTCHGSPEREGDFLSRSAPPRDLLGADQPSFPGVGAHAIHLNAAPTHAAIACSECHLVPARTDSPGHADTARPAELVFGAIATTRDRRPEYDAVTRTCSDTYCHRGADAVWTEPKTSDEACGSCHGLPPALPHPQSPRCSACHSDVVDEHRRFVAPELHVNGIVETSRGSCVLCHGSEESAAPPPDTSGNVAETAVGVGAHAVHLAGGEFGRALACDECHAVPGERELFSHAGALPAEVRLSGVAETGNRSPHWERASLSCVDSWCHGPSAGAPSPSPSWIVPGALGCTSCHGMPPPAPHPRFDDCSACHGDVVDADDVTIVDRLRHVDGIVDVRTDQSCTQCHGSDDPAPPRDLAGRSSTRFPGVGAHRVHVEGTERSRAVPCAECHVVPERLLDTGHVDTPGPAEVVFSGAATAFGATPVYAGGTCESSACHGAVFPENHDSGGTDVTPVWTEVSGNGAACGSCHGLPPPRPHPRGDLNPTCSACHENIAPDNLTFVRPALHVDGVVTFEVP